MNSDYTRLTDAQLWDALAVAQLQQKRHPPTSKEWRDASIIIHALAAENRRRYPRLPVETLFPNGQEISDSGLFRAIEESQP